MIPDTLLYDELRGIKAILEYLRNGRIADSRFASINTELTKAEIADIWSSLDLVRMQLHGIEQQLAALRCVVHVEDKDRDVYATRVAGRPNDEKA